MSDEYEDAEGGDAVPQPGPSPKSSAKGGYSQDANNLRDDVPQSAPSPKSSAKGGYSQDPNEQEYAANQQGSGPARRKRTGNRKSGGCCNCCNSRIDELAKPKRWLILNTWKEHGLRFEPERTQALREKVQEEFSMTPEETADYLAQVRQHQQKSKHNERVRKAELRKEANASRRAADLFLQKRIKRGLIYAYQNPPPLLMSPMLRSVSDKVLEELCALHDVPIPRRGDTDKHSRYLLSAADWTAILTANIYYEVNVKEKEDINRLIEADRCTYVDSEEVIPEKATKGKPAIKKEEGGHADPYTPSEKQMEVTNYDNNTFQNAPVKGAPEADLNDLDPIDEEGG